MSMQLWKAAWLIRTAMFRNWACLGQLYHTLRDQLRLPAAAFEDVMPAAVEQANKYLEKKRGQLTTLSLMQHLVNKL